MQTIIFFLCVIMSFSLSAEIRVLALSGSLRQDSFNKKLVKEAALLARQKGAEVTFVDLKNYLMPFYDADLEAKEGMPQKAKELRQLMIRSNIILIASPEYNGSLSGTLKNAIDWASRNEKGESSRDAFKGKTFVLMSASPGSGGGTRGLVHLRAIIENIGGTVLPQQLLVPKAYEAFDTQGKLINPKLKEDLHQLINSMM